MRRERGFALLVVLWSLVLLGLLLAQVMAAGRSAVALAGNLRAASVARAAADMGIASVAVYSEDDGRSLHLRVADEAVVLPGVGAAAYLNEAAVIAAAHATGCDAVHPGYGFLSENADFAEACEKAGERKGKWQTPLPNR